MANLASSKKRARQMETRRVVKAARRTSLKTSLKKVHDALDAGIKQEDTQVLLSDAASQLGRARGKGLIHANTAARRLSRLTKKVNAAYSTKK